MTKTFSVSITGEAERELLKTLADDTITPETVVDLLAATSSAYETGRDRRVSWEVLREGLLVTRAGDDYNSDTHVFCEFCKRMIHANSWVEHRKACRLVHRPTVKAIRTADLDDLLSYIEDIGRTDGQTPVYILDMFDDIILVSSAPLDLDTEAGRLEEGCYDDD